MEPEFLEWEELIALHERSLAEHGGAEGLRDRRAVESALHAPKADFYYSSADLFGIAAAYAYHIAQAQAFVDGNKRTAISAALTFLELNGVDADEEADVLYDAMIAIAGHRMDKAGLAAQFRELFG